MGVCVCGGTGRIGKVADSVTGSDADSRDIFARRHERSTRNQWSSVNLHHYPVLLAVYVFLD